jgi:hypothetical protein
MPSMFVIRWIMVALTTVLAVLLITRGNVVIGVVLGALTLARVALLVRLQQRRARFRQRRQQRVAGRR